MGQTLYIQVKGDTKQLVTDLKKAENVTVNAGKKMSTGLGSVTKGVNLLKGAVVAYLGVHTVKALVDISDTYTSLESKLKLVTSSTGELKTTQAALLKVANESRTSYEGTVSLYTRLSRSTDTLGVSQDDLLKATEAVSKGLIVAGATLDEANSAMLQLSQGLAKGTLDGDELKSVMEAMPDVMKKVAKSMGVNYGELKKLGSEGKLTSDVIFPALVDILGEVRGEFDQMDVTVGQATTVLKNSFFDIINDANKTSGATDGIATSILDVAKTIRENKEGIVAVFTAFIKGAELAVEGVGLLGKSIQGYVLLYEKLTKVDPLKAQKEKLIALRKELSLLDLVTKDGTRSSAKSREERKRINKAINETIHELGKVKVAEVEYIDTWQKGTKKIITSSTARTKAKTRDEKAYEKAVKEVNDIIAKSTEKTFRKLSFYGANYNKDQIARLDYLDNEWLGINDEIEKDTEKTLVAMGVDIKFYTDEQRDKLTDMADEWKNINDDIIANEEEKYTDLETLADTYIDGYADDYSDFVDDIIKDGDSLSDAWDTLWKSMAATLVDTLSKMAISWAASKISSLWVTSSSASLYHTGLWENVKPGETPAILETSEMVVPGKYAKQIRDNLGDKTSFSELANATNPAEWEATSPTGINIAGIVEESFIDAVTGIGSKMLAGGTVSPGRAVAGAFTQGTFNTISEMMDIELGSLQKESSLLGASSYSSTGRKALQIANALAMSGSPLGVVGSTLTEPVAMNLGGYVGDLVGDFFDDREWEELRDYVEDGKMTITEALARQRSALAHPELSGYSGGSKLGSFYDFFSSTWQSIKDMFSFAPTESFELGPGQGLGQEGTSAAGGEVAGSDGDIESSPGGRGGVHGGMDFIPKETTYMLDRGERVISPRQNQDLTGFLKASGESGLTTEYRRDMLRFTENISLLMDKFDRLGMLERAA